jgi:hypothetical protein
VVGREGGAAGGTVHAVVGAGDVARLVLLVHTRSPGAEPPKNRPMKKVLETVFLTQILQNRFRMQF